MFHKSSVITPLPTTSVTCVCGWFPLPIEVYLCLEYKAIIVIFKHIRQQLKTWGKIPFIHSFYKYILSANDGLATGHT